MSRISRKIFAAVAAAYACLLAVLAAQTIESARDDPVHVTLQLGTVDGDLVINPANVAFERGKLYKLVLTNPSDVEHRLSLAAIAPFVRGHGKPKTFNGKVACGLVFRSRVPVGYRVREIDVTLGGVAAWYFAPTRPEPTPHPLGSVRETVSVPTSPRTS